MSLVAGGALVAPTLLAACGSPEPGPAFRTTPQNVNTAWPNVMTKEVVVAGRGGQFYDLRNADVFQPFGRVSGAKVRQAEWDQAALPKMIAAPHPTCDLVDMDGYALAALVRGGAGPAPLASWVRRPDLVDPAFRDYCAGGYAYSVVLGWGDTGPTPSGWADFFDVGRFPGRRALPRDEYAGMAEIALLADGVAPENVYPLDLDRALGKLEEIRTEIVFYGSDAEGQRLLTDGIVSMIAIPHNRMIEAQRAGASVNWTYDGAVLFPWSGYPLTQRATNMAAANALLDYMSTPEIQATLARKLFLGPTVSAALDMLTPEDLALQPSAPDNVIRQFTVDVSALTAQENEYAGQYVAWVRS